MGILSTDFIIFTLGGVGVSLLELVSVLFGLTNVFLAGRGKSINFWFGYIYAILLFTMFIQKHLYSSMLLQPISLGFTILGHYRWTHPAKDEENKKRELKVTVLSNRERLMFVGGIVLFTVAWGFFMQWISASFRKYSPLHAGHSWMPVLWVLCLLPSICLLRRSLTAGELGLL